MKAVKINLAGRVRYLAFTVEAMFQIQEVFGGSGEMIEAIKDNTREGFSAACKAAAILAEQGELVRRGLGYDPEPMTDAEAIAATMAPSEIAALKVAIPSALTLGYGREIEGDVDEVDLGLAELNTQKKRSNPRSLYPYGDGGRTIEKGNHPIHARRDRGPLGALPPGKGSKEGAGTGGRITPEGRTPPAAEFIHDRHSKQREFFGRYSILHTRKTRLFDLRRKTRGSG